MTKNIADKHKSQTSHPFFLNPKFVNFFFSCRTALTDTKLHTTGIEPSVGKGGPWVISHEARNEATILTMNPGRS